MFKKLIALAALLPGLSLAQESPSTNRPLCSKLDTVLQAIMISEFKELPVWVGDAEKGVKLALVANEKTKTWTMILYDDKTACIMLAGEGYRSFLHDNKK